MVMIGGADDDGVELAGFFFEQFAVVGVATGFGEALSKAVEVRFVDVADGDDVFARDAVDIFRRTIGRADDGDVEFFVGGFGSCDGEPAEQAGRDDRRASAGYLEKATSIES